MDWFLIKSVNAEYPLSCRKCVEKWTFCILCPAGPPKCFAPPPKMVPPYSLGICPPTNIETLWSPIAPSSRKNRFSEGISFWQITQTALELPKIDICQNWPRRVLGDVRRCRESKFAKKLQWEVSQIVEEKFPHAMLLGGLSVNLNHLIKPLNCQLQFSRHYSLNIT